MEVENGIKCHVMILGAGVSGQLPVVATSLAFSGKSRKISMAKVD